MDEIEIEGKIYISSKRAAEITGYTKDYIGQLARGEKVIATRVGRAWYVESNSIRQHAGLPAVSNTVEVSKSPLKTDSQEEERVESIKTEKKVTESSIAALTRPVKKLHSLNALKGGSIQGVSLNTWGDIQYSPDSHPLFLSIGTSVPKEEEQELDTEISVPIAISVKQEEVKQELPSKKEFKRKASNIKIPLKTKLNRMQPFQKTKNLPQLLLQTSYIAIFVSFLIGVSSFGGIYIPSEWAFTSVEPITATLLNTGDNTAFILDFFSTIFTDSIDLIATFIATLFASLADFFSLGLNFVLDLIAF